MRRLGLLLAILLPATSRAAWPEDVTLRGMAEHDGIHVGGLEVDTLKGAYRQLIRELGASIATGTILPPDTLGVTGFELAVEANLGFTDTGWRTEEPSPWERAHQDEAPGSFFWAPGLTVRKGLPFSVELGLTGRWVGGSRQGIFGGFGRVALVEGYKPWPDVAVRLGYTGYVGNDELELGVLDLGGTLGSRFRFGPEGTLRATSLSPYVDVSLLVITAAPLLDDATLLELGAASFGRRSSSDVVPAEKAITTARFSAGLELRSHHFLIRISGGYTLGAIGNVAVAAGFSY